MRGVSRVVLVTSPVVHQELNVMDSALRAGVEHVVKITSKASADSPIARRRNQAERERAHRLRARLNAPAQQRLHAEHSDDGALDQENERL
jgi:hypothetical protein